MHDVFISYSSKDFSQAETVRNVLEKNGIPCWMAPRDIPGGSNYTKEIPSAIRNCQVFVLILSQNAQSSHWVLKELDSAVNCGKVILPFMLEDCQLNDEFNFLLTGAQRYAAYQKKVEAMEKLIGRIRAITEDRPAVQPMEEVPKEPEPQKEPEETVSFFGMVKCPACGGQDLEELTGKIGRYTAVEKLTALAAPVLALLGVTVLPLVVMVVLLVIGIYDLLMMIVTLASAIGGLVGGWYFGSRMTKEWIRRQRIRHQLCEHPFRCRACRKEFLLEKQ